MNDIKSLKPFTRFLMTIGELPSSYLISMTYEEQLLWFCNYLEKTVIPTVNNNAEAVIELQNYIKNYFDNLDVQEEINNKLDDMAESGQLTDIIAQYLELAGVLAYNTKADLKAATNITEGSICKTLGTTTYNDGYGYFYKIRTITSGDIVDDNNILALEVSNTLIAEKILNQDIINLNQSVTAINNKLSLFDNKKYLFVGDSYAVGYQGSGVPTIEGYFTKVTNNLNLNSQIIASNGYGFKGLNGNLKWKDLIEGTTISDKSSFTDIIICGGMNDKDYVSDVPTESTNLFNYLKTNFPNATIHVGFVGRFKQNGTEAEISKLRQCERAYKITCAKNNVKFIENSFDILHNISWFISDNVHPNTNGEIQLAYGIQQYITNGKITDLMSYQDNNDFATNSLTPSSNIVTTYLNTYTYIDKNNVGVLISGYITFTNPISYTSGNYDIDVGQYTNGYLGPSIYNQGMYMTVPAKITFNETLNGSHTALVNVRVYNDKQNHLHITIMNALPEGGELPALTISSLLLMSSVNRQIINSRFC